MHKVTLRVRAWSLGTLMAAALSACGGGGGDSAPPAPTAIPESLAITAPATAESASAVAFGNSAGALAGLKYQWDFGDGTNSTDAAPSHTYASGGEFEVVLKVSNEVGSSRETRTKVAITNLANVRGLDCTGTASSGWCWQNPRPTGNRVNSVFFLNATTGWRGGDNGEVFKTTDGGTTWVRQSTGISASIFGIRFLNATTGWATGAYGAVLRTTDGGATWSVAKLPDAQYGGADLSTITALDAKTVYLGRTLTNGGTGYYGLYVTKDGGATWQSISNVPHAITSASKFWALQYDAISTSQDGGASYTSVLSLKPPTGYSYFDSANLWALDDKRALAYTRVTGFDLTNIRWTYVDTVYTTVDGGVNWSKAELTGAATSLSIQRILDISADGSVILASAYNGLLRSADGGKTWTTLPGPSVDYYSVSYASLGNGEIAASGYAGLWLSKDGGQTWTKLATPTKSGVSIPVDYLKRVEAGTLMAADGQGSFLLSRDNGQSWTQVVTPVGDGYDASSTVAFSDAKNGFMFDASGRTFTTKDGGLTWEAKTLALGTVRGVQFVSKQNGWLVSGDGRLYKSTDGGQTWSTTATAAGVSYSSVQFLNDTVGWSLRYGGGAQYAATRDGGKTWTELALPYGVTALRQGDPSWVAVGNNGAVYVTTDAGATWNAVYTGTAANLTALAFSDAKTVWAVGNGSTLLKSEDGGAKWTLVKLPAANTLLRDIKFANAKVGWIVGDGGVILATQDGGKTWRPQASGTSYGLTAIQAVDANTAWVTGSSGIVLATGTGGN